MEDGVNMSNKCTAIDRDTWHDVFNKTWLESRIRDWSSFAENHGGLKHTLDLFDTYKIKQCETCQFSGLLFKIAFSIRFMRRELNE